MRLGLPPTYVPETGDEAEAAYEAFIDLLRSPNTRSGFQQVYPFRGKWQAKVYVGPGDQRSLGVFDRPRDAATAVFNWKIDGSPPLPEPKPRNKRGEGRAA